MKYLKHKIINNTLVTFVSSIILLGSTSLSLAETSIEGPKKSFSAISAYSAQYQLKSSKYKLSTKATRNLSINEKNIAVLEQNASVFVAKIDQESSFFINNNDCEIIANNYSFHRSVFGKKKDYRISFDYQKKQFTEKNDDEEKVREIKGKLYDELSYQEALRCELKNKEAIKTGQEFSYIVRTKGRNKDYTFIVSGLEKIETEIGTIDSVKLSRVRDKESEGKDNHIWFSQQHDYLLVKFRQEEDDDTYSLDIKSLDIKSLDIKSLDIKSLDIKNLDIKK